ncbi:hypothetical protein KCU71_g16763, partial [Aureobasidium melanogenum]
MADPFSIAVSVGGLVSLGIQLVQGLNQYAGSALDSKGRIRAISTDINLTVQVVQTLDTTIQDEANKATMKDDAARLIQETIAQCRDIFTKIQSTLPEYSATGPRKRDVIIWPFIEPKLDLLRGNLEKLKTSLQLLMNVIILAAMSKRHADQTVLNQQRLEIEKLLKEKAAAELRLEGLERNYTQILAADSPASTSSDKGHMPSVTQQSDFVGLAKVEPSSDSEHTDRDQLLGADRKASLAEHHTQNDSLMTDLYCDYTACLQQIKMLQTSLETALNEMFDPATGFPTVNSRLTSRDRRLLARTVDKSARETLECLNQRILQECPNTEVIKQHKPSQLDWSSDTDDAFHSLKNQQNWLRPEYPHGRLRVEEQHSISDDSMLDTGDWAIISNPDQTSSSAFLQDHKRFLSEGPLRSFSCNICSCRFLRWEHSKRHNDSHFTYGKPFEYGDCEKTFSRTGDLTQHQHTSDDSVVPSDMPQHDFQRRRTACCLL